jgi:hypothetical protein
MKDCISKIDDIEKMGPKARDGGTSKEEAEQYFAISAKKVKASAPR